MFGHCSVETTLQACTYYSNDIASFTGTMQLSLDEKQDIDRRVIVTVNSTGKTAYARMMEDIMNNHRRKQTNPAEYKKHSIYHGKLTNGLRADLLLSPEVLLMPPLTVPRPEM